MTPPDWLVRNAVYTGTVTMYNYPMYQWNMSVPFFWYYVRTDAPQLPYILNLNPTNWMTPWAEIVPSIDPSVFEVPGKSNIFPTVSIFVQYLPFTHYYWMR